MPHANEKRLPVLNELLQDPLFARSAPGATLRAKPLGFIDIGARGGVHEVVEPLAGVTAVLGFEPDKAECERLRTELAAGSPWAACEIEPWALAAGDGEASLFVLSSPVNSSLRPPNPDFIDRYKMTGFDQVGRIPLQTASLDKLLFGARSTEDYWGEFIKIDTQGTEFEILEGAGRTLAERTVAILSEVEFFEMYQGEKLFSEIEIFLRGHGFAFHGFDVHFRSRKLLDKHKAAGRERAFFADAVFFKDPLRGGRSRAPLSERGNHVLFSCALLLGYYDFALQLALETWATGEEAGRIESLVRNQAASVASRAYRDALELAERVRANPDLANLEVGRFVDRRRYLSDYDDIE